MPKMAPEISVKFGITDIRLSYWVCGNIKQLKITGGIKEREVIKYSHFHRFGIYCICEINLQVTEGVK